MHWTMNCEQQMNQKIINLKSCASSTLNWIQDMKTMCSRMEHYHVDPYILWWLITCASLFVHSPHFVADFVHYDSLEK
jgi:hypothetical protein